MHPFQLISESCAWFGRNFAYNLDFIPDDKLNWKPSETAKSALEITTEVLGVFNYVLSLFEADSATAPDYAQVTTRDEAKAKIISTTKGYAAFLLTLKPEDLEGAFQTDLGPFPKNRLAIMPVQELNHHHGQITYLQTIWGDTDSHFHEMDPNYKPEEN